MKSFSLAIALVSFAPLLPTLASVGPPPGTATHKFSKRQELLWTGPPASLSAESGLSSLRRGDKDMSSPLHDISPPDKQL